MKKCVLTSTAWMMNFIVSLFLLATPAALAGEDRPTGEAAVAVLSKYVWRGYELSRNSVVVQPSMTIGWKGFSANLWGNLDTNPYCGGSDGRDCSSSWNETDAVLSYTRTVGPISIGGGYIYYGLGALNQNAADRRDSQEIFISAALNTVLEPTLTVYKEVDYYRNWYFLLGISHAFELNKAVSLRLAATASYLLSTNEKYPEFDGNALPTGDKFSNFHDGSLTVGLPIKVKTWLVLTPAVSYVFPLTREAKNEIKGFGLSARNAKDRDSSFFLGGVTAGIRF